MYYAIILCKDVLFFTVARQSVFKISLPFFSPTPTEQIGHLRNRKCSRLLDDTKMFCLDFPNDCFDSRGLEVGRSSLSDESCVF